MAGQVDSLRKGPGLAVVSVKNLQLPSGVSAPNVWGIHKEQPAVVTVNLYLSEGFSSAASKDALDQNTIHYGDLAKRIRAGCSSGQTEINVLLVIQNIIAEMGMRANGTFRLSRAEIELQLPKASMFGESVSLFDRLCYNEHDQGQATTSQRSLHLRDMKVMTLIGVNEYERKAKQPVIASLDVRLSSTLEDMAGGQTARLFGVERTIAQIIETSAFETLEALAEHATEQLQEQFRQEGLACSEVDLRLEKPRAIPFADASVVEISKRLPGPRQINSTQLFWTTDAMVGNTKPTQLRIVKPYV